MLVVDDDHGLTKPKTLKTAGKAMAEFLDVGRRPAAYAGVGAGGLDGCICMIVCV